jgi:hypothetical protein
MGSKDETEPRHICIGLATRRISALLRRAFLVQAKNEEWLPG